MGICPRPCCLLCWKLFTNHQLLAGQGGLRPQQGAEEDDVDPGRPPLPLRLLQLATNSITFKRAASSVQRAVWVKNMKVTIALALAVLLFLYFFVSLSCGGLSWSVCIEE